ncbi:MAG: 5'/3'-nucleotidase SurE [Chlorobiaceae bacterium]|nr:5'/3'-nucleotidase SurE [Chlorobiaceae bacterium]MBA4309963.1 5'/3'-nucleotidase SurE [Chlorobiaceae bacterium]
MRILVSNDDGIYSQGINFLVNALKEIGDVTVVAPLYEQSAVGHAITMKVPLRVVEVNKNGKLFGYGVDGTPADCVKMGIRNIMPEPPDLVVSGINHGSNTATNIVYSGTVSAAREAAIMDFPAIAISLTSHNCTRFLEAGNFAKKIVDEVYKNGLKKGTLLNINIPDVAAEFIKGVMLTKQGRSKWDDVYEKRIDPYGKEYYWLTGNFIDLDHDLTFDQFAVKNNYISVTPVHFDLTDYETYDVMNNWKIENIKLNP